MQLLHSQIFGEGEPLLILHGFLGMSDNWKRLGNQYAEKNHQVHLIDQRNHGKSFHSKDFNYDFLVEDLKFYMNHYSISSAIILGHSMGGKTVMQFACTYPEMTKKLIVADIAPRYYPPHHHLIIDSLNKIDLGSLTKRSEADEFLANYITDFGTRQFLLKNLYWIEKGKLAFRMNLPVLSERMEEVGENINPTDNYEGPTLFLKGDQSEYITKEDTPEIKRHFPKAEIKTIDNAGHWLHAQNPKQFFDFSYEFMISS
ncbi:alpha/beta fold hydrolase [Cellulophaga baltica]|uniref:alpha/beta fold hydrolase n=1 Tax=Cellulophaga TaxID=104264 RepID=UPI001C069A72|nr:MULTISPECIES: alpha/beta fold hydrolase [Cellulophaga]MBU2995159.1 alpha/beta fold hydrolase [Cellulophaga baltica]MDO6766554.1 alpha/beta fold hydrolase [Cellulophaga sp. 1_MG-2023]